MATMATVEMMAATMATDGMMEFLLGPSFRTQPVDTLVRGTANGGTTEVQAIFVLH